MNSNAAVMALFSRKNKHTYTRWTGTSKRDVFRHAQKIQNLIKCKSHISKIENVMHDVKMFGN
jgi:hypothetical protein